MVKINLKNRSGNEFTPWVLSLYTFDYTGQAPDLRENAGFRLPAIKPLSLSVSSKRKTFLKTTSLMRFSGEKII